LHVAKFLCVIGGRSPKDFQMADGARSKPRLDKC